MVKVYCSISYIFYAPDPRSSVGGKPPKMPQGGKMHGMQDSRVYLFIVYIEQTVGAAR
jgi:hypothetical protein